MPLLFILSKPFSFMYIISLGDKSKESCKVKICIVFKCH